MDPSDGQRRPSRLDRATLAMLWAVVLLELILPVPGFLTLGAIVVLAARPPWFLATLRRHYGEQR